MTELVQHHTASALSDQMDYARAVSAGSLLPREYQGNPANVLIAVGLGQAMGLSPAESLYRITVIQGKPTASAELIASNVRKAGHRLRVVTDEQAMRVTATIIRSDDPDFEHTVTRDMAWAQAMGLSGKDNYKKQPLTMLEWRAISAVARKACSEALYGVGYTPDEIERDPEPATVKTPGVAGLRAAVQPRTDSTPADPIEAAEAHAFEAEMNSHNVEDAVEVPETGEQITEPQRRKMFALFGEAGFTTDARSEEGRTQRLAYISQVIGHDVASTSALTSTQASNVIESLIADADALTAESEANQP